MEGCGSGGGGVTYREKVLGQHQHYNWWHSQFRCIRLQMQRCACVLLVAGHIITWCELNDHTQRNMCIQTANFGLVEHRYGDRRKAVVTTIKAVRVETAC